jgi:hypothetical protein
VIFKKLLTRRSTKSTEIKQYLKPFPVDFGIQCDESISLLKKAKGNSEKILDSQAEQLFLDSIEWINNGLEIDLESFLRLIQAIQKYIPGDNWVEGNPFRVHYDLYSEGIRNSSFFLDDRNQEFLSNLVGMGVDGQHLACCVIQDCHEAISPETIGIIFASLMKMKVATECEHWHETVIPGHPLIELIRNDLLSEQQLKTVFEYSENLKGKEVKHLRSLLRLYLAKSGQVPMDCLKKLAKDSEKVWGWVDMDGNVNSEEESIADSAKVTLEHLTS